VDDLVEKVRKQNFRTVIQKPLKTTIEQSRKYREVGDKISQFGMPKEGESLGKRLLKAPLAPLTTLVGGTMYGIGSTAERFAKPRETLSVFKKAPTLKPLSEGLIGTFEEPTKAGIALDVFGAGLDVTDVGRYGLIGLFGAGIRETPGVIAKSGKTASVLDDISEGFEAARAARKGTKKIPKSVDVRTQLLDRLTPIFELTKKAGKELPTEVNPYKRMRLIAGIGGKIDATLNQGLAPVLQRNANNLEDLSRLLVLQRNQELIERGVKTKFSAAEVSEGLLELKAKYGATDNLSQGRLSVTQQPSVKGGVRPKEAGQSFFVDARGQAIDVAEHKAEAFGKSDLRVVTTPNELNIETKRGFLPEQIDTLKRMFNKIKSKNPNAKIIADTPQGSGTFKSVDELVTQQPLKESKVGISNGFKALEQSAQEVRDYGNSLLKLLNESGIIDNKSYKQILAKNEMYVPFRIVDYISDSAESGKYARTSFNVAKQDVIKALKGSEKAVADPLESLVERTGKVISLVERNNALKSLVNLQDELPDLIKKAGKTTEKGFDTVNLFENGKNVKYALPSEVAAAIKNLDQQTSNVLIDILRPQARLLRTGATGLNVGFIPANIVRDIADAIFSETTERGLRGAGELLASYPRAIFSALKRDDLYRTWQKAGGAQSTFTSQLLDVPKQTVGRLAGTQRKGVLETIKSPLEFLNRVGEESTRIARFQSGLEKGEATLEAAFKARDITVDFAKSGNTVKLLNQIVPFLNANVQGVERMFRLAKSNPKQAAVGLGILSGFPATMLYLHNRRFEDYKDIPQFEKDQNWIIIADDRSELEKVEGEPIKGIKIPKGHFTQPFTAMVESALEAIGSDDPKALGTLAQRTASNISPIGITPREIGSSILPPLFQAGVETIFNQNLFTGYPVVPRSLQNVSPEEQYRETTPKGFIAAGKALGVSPLKLQNIVRTTTGGLLGTLNPGQSIAKRFTNIRTGAEVDQLFDEVDGFRTESATASLKDRREAEKLFTELKDQGPAIAKQRLLQIARENPELVEDVLDIAEADSRGITALDRSIKSLPVKDGSRAKFVFSQLNKMQSGEEKKNYLLGLARKKVISESVLEQVLFLQEQKTKQAKQSLETERKDFIAAAPPTINKNVASELFDSVVDELAKANPFDPPEAQAKAGPLGEMTFVIEKDRGVTSETVERQSIKDFLMEKIKVIRDKIFGGSDDETVEDPEPTQAPLPTEIPTETPTPTPQLRVNTPSYYRSEDSNQIVIQSGGQNEDVNVIDVPPEISETITNVFGRDLALEAARVLHHQYGEQVKGYGQGENTEFKISNITVSNEGHDTPLTEETRKVLDKKGDDGYYHSFDKGLFRINSRRFEDIMRDYRPGYRDAMYEAGIIDDPYTDKPVTKAVIQKYWNEMDDLEKNVKMAKIIYEISGSWEPWFAAPIDLIR